MENVEEQAEEKPMDLWTNFKYWLFMKLGNDLWGYQIIHDDHWGRIYGISFTHDKTFFKRVRYDTKDISEDLEEECKK